MKRIAAMLVILTITLRIVFSPFITLPQQKPTSCNWEVYFSLHGGATDAMIQELNKVRSTIFVQAYAFTSAPIAKAPPNAHKREMVILDKSQLNQKYSSATFLYNQVIPVKIAPNMPSPTIRLLSLMERP